MNKRKIQSDPILYSANPVWKYHRHTLILHLTSRKQQVFVCMWGFECYTSTEVPPTLLMHTTHFDIFVLFLHSLFFCCVLIYESECVYLPGWKTSTTAAAKQTKVASVTKTLKTVLGVQKSFYVLNM